MKKSFLTINGGHTVTKNSVQANEDVEPLLSPDIDLLKRSYLGEENQLLPPGIINDKPEDQEETNLKERS